MQGADEGAREGDGSRECACVSARPALVPLDRLDTLIYSAYTARAYGPAGSATGDGGPGEGGGRELISAYEIHGLGPGRLNMTLRFNDTQVRPGPPRKAAAALAPGREEGMRCAGRSRSSTSGEKAGLTPGAAAGALGDASEE